MLNIKFIVSVLILQIFCGQLVFAQPDRGVVNKPTLEKRLALVIGNGAYQHTSPLPNPSNDATDMAATLKTLGFEVISGINQNKLQMENLIRQFGNRLRDTKGVGLVFYAGHGIQADGANYLIPVDADIKDEDEVSNFSINLSFLLGKMNSAGNGFNIVILDACRNNPFARSWRNYRDLGEKGGLAKVDAPTGTLIAYATKPGATASDGDGKNGLYTSVLLKQMTVKNVDVTKMLQNVRAEVLKQSGNQQVPFDESSLVGDFYFAGTDGSGSSVNSFPINNQPGINVEAEFWNAIKDSTDVEDFKLYNQKYPNGIYGSIADLKIKKLTILPGTLSSNSLGMRFVYIPPGTFQMGDSSNGPVHRVTLSRGFYMGQTEVTQAQWVAMMGNNPSRSIDFPAMVQADNLPVQWVSWEEAQEFISKLNARGDGTYRLPTEAEWEYAARAGTIGDFAGDLDTLGWTWENSGDHHLSGEWDYSKLVAANGRTHPVGTKQPNAWGLYDMHGNVWEWTADWAGGYPGESVIDPKGAATGQYRVLRGGSFNNFGALARSANRNPFPPEGRNNNVGFRVVRTN